MSEIVNRFYFWFDELYFVQLIAVLMLIILKAKKY